MVELGAGTGALTTALQHRLAGRGRHLAIERHGPWAELLRRRYPQVEVVHAADLVDRTNRNVHRDRVEHLGARPPRSPLMRLDEYFRDPHPPPVQDLIVLGFAVVRDHRDRVLLVRRSDDGNWELPGGQVEVGETVSSAVTREVAEESGISVDLTGVSGIYSDPTHIVVYPGGARQQCALCFHARPNPPDQQPRPDHDETTEAAWFTLADARSLRMHPDVRRRLAYAVDHVDTVNID